LSWDRRTQAAGERVRPNILLVVTDDQGYWDTGVSGNEKIDTPTMDRLAREGVQFTHFYAEMVCSPTRAGLLTGRSYLRTGLYNTRFGGDTLGVEASGDELMRLNRIWLRRVDRAP
jgi:arylsulfatase A